MSAACDESRAALSDGDPTDPAGAERVRRHRAGCTECQAFAARIESVAAPVREIDATLDDMARKRIAAKLGPALDEIATQHAARSVQKGPWRRRLILAAATVAAAAAIVIALRLRDRAVAHDPAALAVIRPFVVGGGELDLLDRPREKIEIPAGALVRATLADRARITVIGPARLTVTSASPAAIALRLDEGTLLAAYDHAAGGALTVESPGYSTRVVGTLFAVVVEHGETKRVAVAHGTVELWRENAMVGRINGGWAFAPGSAALHSIHADLRALLDEHEAVLPPIGASGIVQVSGMPEHADVISGVRLGPAPLSARVSVGEVQLSVRAIGRAEARFSTPVARDVASTLRYSLEIAAVQQPAPAAVAPPQPIAPPTIKPRKEHGPADSVANPIAPPAPPAETADTIYARAEAAKRDGDPTRAHALLAEVVSRFPEDALANSALYELGRDAHAAHDDEHARAFLDELLASGGDSSLREPARYLRCRIELDAKHDAAAMRCLQAFRRDYPSSPHDAEALALLAVLAQTAGDCALARPLLDEYLRSYPTGPFAADARTRRARCEK
jgi:TolA-binding protein/ferric-dicitrate binding protein FerR (iron transport regulator)